MCRLICFKGKDTKVNLADLLVKPSHSIIKQSKTTGERGVLPKVFTARPPGHGCRERLGDASSILSPQLNADGFGVCWYDRKSADPCIPAVYTSISPAWNDMNLFRIAPKIESDLIFGHVRAASPGTGVHSLNCHPFSSGAFCFMHNGHIAGFAALRRKMVMHMSDTALAAVRGTTDSEVRRLSSTQSNVFHWVRSVSVAAPFWRHFDRGSTHHWQSRSSCFLNTSRPRTVAGGWRDVGVDTCALRLSLSVFVPPSLVLL